MSKDELPSINDVLGDNNLPSYKDFIEKKEELPSVKEYISESNQNTVEEETQTIEDANGESFLEVSDIVNAPEWSELVRLVNDVRKDIPEIPEIKYYDSELSEICEKIIEIQENLSRFDVKSDKIYELNEKNEEFEVKLSEIESKIPQVPEIKYYDSDIDSIFEKIQQISEGIDNLPEIKHYDNEIKSISVELEKVKSRDVPDFRWIGNTFNCIDEDFERVQGHLSLIREKIESEVSQLTDTIHVKEFEQNINVKNLNESIERTNTKIEETKDKIYSELSQSSLKIWEYHREFKDDDRKLKKSILGEQNKLKQSLQKEIEEFNEQSVKTDEKLLKFFNDLKVEVSLLPEVKYYDEDILTLKNEIHSLRDGLKDLNEIASLIKKDQKELKENYLLSEPPNEKETAGGQTDPLTPLDQKFATFKDLESHYRLFLNRIQVQLSTIGGGGAGFIKDLDDVTFDDSTGENKLLIYNGTKWVGIASTALSGGSSSVGVGGTWATTSAGIHTTKNVGIATTARSEYALYVEGDQYVDGNITVGGTITYDDVKNVDSIGLITARTGVDVLAGGINVVGVSTISTGVGTVHVGYGQTALFVDGDARITGIFTVGRSSVTIDGENNTVSVGLVTVTNSTIILGDNVTIDAGASGINSAPNVLYVAKDGNDSNNGTSIDNAKLTIAGAVSIAQSGTTIKVLSGNYVENNPIELPAFTAVVGDDLRTVKVLPSTTTSDIFHVNKGCKLANMTFSGHVHPAAAVAFPTGIATNVGGGKWKGPYIQNCTSDTTTGTGIYIDGNKAVKTKSMNVDAFTQYNQGGVGVAVTNEGYAQLVSVFTICCNEAITVHKGGQADLANSNCSFGTFGLVADGVSPEQFTGTVGITTSSGGGSSTDYSEVTLSGLSPSSFNQTYTRQSTGFVLDTGTVSSGNALFHADSNYYYYVASTGSMNNSRMLIYSVEDNSWMTVFDFNGTNFTEGNVSNNQAIGSSGIFDATVTSSNTTADGRNVPTASSDIVYATSGGGGGEVVGTGTATAGQDNVIVNVGAVTTRPYDGQVVYFDKLYRSVDTITITSGGSGYTSTPSVTISSPTGPNGEVATAFATLEDGVVTEIDIISSGSQYDPTDTVTVTISAPDSGTTATATANLADTYYTINSSTPISAGITTLTLAENLLNTVGVGSTAYFFQQSKIIASSHTFEYIGSGNDIASATPKRGGVTIQANEVVTQNGGSVIYTSTDQAGNFRIGDEFQINQNTGTISGRAFSKSLFSEMTPFILALS